MAKKFENEKGFLIIEMSPEEAKFVNFGLEEGCVCMSCNNICEDKVYYIAALNDVMDRKCLDEWLSTAVRYEEDMAYETNHYKLYSELLKIYG